MTKSEVNRYRNILQDRQSELAMVLRKREGIAIEKSPDALDEVQHAAERELALRNLDRDSNLLRNVNAGLRRIQDGSFGVCANCEEPINSKRLEAVPWTAFCVRCQEIADQRQETGAENFDDMLINAA